MADDLVSIDIYPEFAHEEDLIPDIGIETDERTKQIYEACKGLGTDESELIEAIGATLPIDRFEIAIRYKEWYEKDLKDVMQSESSGDFGLALKMCSFGPVEAECYMIKQACKGMGSHKGVLFSILCGRSNRDMQLLKKTYYKMYTKDLASHVASETGGDLAELLSSCMQAAAEEFDPDFHTLEKALEDAQDIYKAGQGKWFGTNEKKLFKVIALAPRKHLYAVNEQYADQYGYTLVKAMEKELSGKAEEAAIFTCNMRLKPYIAIAKLIKSACAGIGTDELLLSTCVIRYQDIMGHVNMAHEELFGKSVQDRVKSECDGDYKKLLLALLNAVSPEE